MVLYGPTAENHIGPIQNENSFVESQWGGKCKDLTLRFQRCCKENCQEEIRCCFWRREWQPTPVFLPGEFHGQRSLVGCSPWGCKESDMTERLILILSASEIPPSWLLWVSEWKSLSCVRLLATPWTIKFMEFSRPILEWVAFPFSRGSS